MKKNYLLLFVLITIVVISSILIYWKFIHMTFGLPTQHKDKVFQSGDAKQIRSYLSSEGSTIGLGNFYALIRRDRSDLLEILLKEYKIAPDFGAKYKDDTPLIFAAEELKSNTIAMLLKYGADVNYKNNKGETALTIASKAAFLFPENKDSSRKISKMLINAGADVNTVSQWGNTPIGGAIDSKDMVNVEFIIDNGGDINYISKSGSNYLFSCFNMECINYFFNKGLGINSMNNSGENVIQNSVTGRIEKVEDIMQIIKLGADICHKDNDGNTVLHYVETAEINPHRKTENPEFYFKKVEEHKNSKLYKYLEKEYNERCKKSPISKSVSR